MKILFALLLGCVGAWCGDVIRHDFEPPAPDGHYRWAIHTAEGVYHEQRGELTASGQLVEGQYQYTAPNGLVVNVVYIADHNGFRPTLRYL